MATNPTREQRQARDQFAEALVLIADGARLDGKGRLDATGLSEIARRIAGASSAFGLDEIVARALERRCRALGLTGGSAELLTLMETDIKPLEMLLLPVDEFKELVGKLAEELGDV